MKDNARIVFLGTPEFAAASLKALVKAGMNVVAVVTAPDRPAGRGMELKQSAVKQLALELELPVLQPEKLKSPGFLEELKAFKADIQVVVAFRMLPEVVWNMPLLGTINLHGSLLPQYRGAAPINWAIINGESITGVTTFKLKHEIDTGNILLREEIPIGERETAGELHDRMMIIGADLVVRTVRGLFAGELKEQPQDTGMEIKHAPKIFTSTCEINWNQPVKKVYDLVRGLSPYPAAFTQLDGKILKIFSAEKITGDHNEVPGHMETDKKSYLRFYCADGYLDVTELQLQGKKRLKIKEFLRGYRG